MSGSTCAVFSISSAVVSRPSVSRMLPFISSSSRPVAFSTWLGSMLPEVLPSSHLFGYTSRFGGEIPIVTGGHGTAYDIAGKNIVKPSAVANAIKMCAQMANARAAK